jgi:hypothetical protein
VEGKEGTSSSPGALMFKEQWRTPELDVDFRFTGGARTGPFQGAFFSNAGGSFDRNSWLFAAQTFRPVEYRIKPVSVFIPERNGFTYDVNTLSSINMSAAGNAINCLRHDSPNHTCVSPSGPYAYTVHHALDSSGSDRSRNFAHGLMMPLKWIVEGTIYD